MIAFQKISSRHSIIAMARRALVTLIASAFCVSQTASTRAQSTSVPIVRDAEIEALVTDYATPIIKTAGLSKRAINIVLVNNRSFNAFVDGRRIFINTGALLQAETPNEIIGVLAHETGHLAGGHQFKASRTACQCQDDGCRFWFAWHGRNGRRRGKPPERARTSWSGCCHGR